ncbi:hypothetical protein HELRODRAFT_96051 [Helobdella robusta]|uniref:Amino acid transporter transmembrane domain-containing protein n=1 Tax=Helobdella robusta TaxID=6412 RepID=T1G999_HELRO|nr:hypothetical protein HELRODRAFT_96051 [Helobdella robusta]ESN92740.1 hypothetical protein HELRODRAFT_96051 [Helobdella robusta]
MNLMKGNIGTGILALPAAFKFGGLWVSLACLFLIGVMAIHCMHLLVKASRLVYEKAGQSGMDYGQVVAEVFLLGPHPIRKLSRHMKIVTYVFLSLTQFGFCTAYIVFISYNIQLVVEEYSPSTRWSPQVYQSIVFLVLLPYLCITHLKILSFFSTIANILMIFGLAVVLYSCFVDIPSTNLRPAHGSWNDFPLFFSIAIFTFEGIGLILPIESQIQNPRDFNGTFGIINLGMIIVTCLYAAVGFYGYLKYGDDVKGSITLNLPGTIFYNIVRLSFALSIFLTYAVQFYVPIEFIWSTLQEKLVNRAFCHRFGEYFLRVFFLIITYVLAAIVPYLELVISLVGALVSTSVALTIPALLDIILCSSIYNYDNLQASNVQPQWFKLKILKNVLIVFVGVLGTVVGSVVTISAIVRASEHS